jgi:ABC-type sugar transport system substrate-binding protein
MSVRSNEEKVSKRRRWRSWIPATAGLLTVSVALGACGSSGSAGGKKTVGVLVPESSDNTYSAAYMTKLQQLATQDNVQLKVYNAKYDAATQAAQASAMFAQKPAAAIFWPAAPTGAAPILLQAKQAGIPVDITNSGLSASDAPAGLYHAFTGPGNFQEGADDADLMNQALGGKGRIVVIEGQPGNSTNTARTDGFKTHLKQVAPGIQIIGDEPGFWEQPKAESVMAELLSRFANNIDGVYADDDLSAAGVIQAIQAANIPKGKIKVVAAGGTRQGLADVASGWLYGTLFQSPYEDATLAMQTILKVLNHQPVPKSTNFPTPPVTAKTVSQFKPLY